MQGKPVITDSASATQHAADPILFTPGPLNTRFDVKSAMLHDVGSRDASFIELVAQIRSRLLDVAGVSHDAFASIPVQGSGTFALEAVISSAVPRDGLLLVIENGHYGRRLAQIAEAHEVPCETISVPERAPLEPEAVAEALSGREDVTHVAVVHCETSTGRVNPVGAIGDAVARHCAAHLIVDGMSSFGAIPLDLEAAGVDYLVSSPNKCLEGVPGFGFVVARKSRLRKSVRARTVVLDLVDQWQVLESTGQFRFTPPIQVFLAFDAALDAFDDEGGRPARAARFKRQYEVVAAGMSEMGFEAYLPPAPHQHVITTYVYPDHAAFDFDRLYSVLREQGLVIYPGKVTDAECFRVGHIGQQGEGASEALIAAIRTALIDMGVELPLNRAEAAPSHSKDQI
jgi:2-aminoethylphosphonate-pyruvate transaminase